MKNFKTFLLEFKGAGNEATLVFHKLLSMLDKGHVDVTATDVTFNVGAVIKSSSYNNLVVKIRQGAVSSTKLGIHKVNQKKYIIIETPEVPTKEHLVDFLENVETAKPFISAFEKYLVYVHQEPKNAHKTKDEMVHVVNNDQKFEEMYNTIVKSVDAAIDSYRKARGEGEQLFNKFNVGKQETQKITHSILRNEAFGKNEAEFATKFMKEVPEVEHLNKDMKEKMESRLKSLYVSKIADIE
jgi:hypothetical protein